MKKGFFVFLILFLPSVAAAHSADQLPFVKINDQDAKVYPVGSTSLTDLKLPQDLAASAILVDRPVHFQLETDNLPILPEFIPKTKWDWDFGDGSTGIGLEPVHTYTKPGSYIIDLHTTAPDNSTPSQLLDSIKLDVLPNLSYVLPQAVLKINGKQSSNPYTDVLKFDFSTPLDFDLRSSRAPASHIVKYQLDFGDQKESNRPEDTHTYDARYNYVLPMMRVTDENGFFADTLVQVQDTQDPNAPRVTPPATNPSKPVSPEKAPLLTWLAIPIALLFFSGLLGWEKLTGRKAKLKKKKKGSRELK